LAGDPDGAVQKQVALLFEAGNLGGWGDGALIERFFVRRDEEAFAALVERHGPMVLGVCRAVVRDEHEAHDAFQATFLVLVRRARSLWVRETIGPWLHGVAWRIAMRARAAAGRRKRHERRAAEMASRPVEGAGPAEAEALIHEEVNGLPDRFRTAVVLCDLEGLTTDQAAARLGSPVGTVRSRLTRGRDRLRARLIRRGLAPAIGAAVASGKVSAAAVVPAALAEATVRVAVDFAGVGAVSAHLAWLMKGGGKLMSIKGLAAVGIVAGLVAGVGGLAAQVPADGQAKAKDLVKVVGEPSKTTDAPHGEAVAKPASLAELLASDRRRLEGKWMVVKVTKNGHEVDDSRFVLAPVLITRDQIQVSSLGTNGAVYDYRIDPRAKPRAMRVARSPGMMGGGGGSPAWWLYAFEGETLKIALDDNPSPAQQHRRPKDFNEVDAEHPITVLELVRDEEPTARASANPQGANPKAPAGDDLAKLQGTWSVVALEQDGEDVSPIPEPGIVIAGNAWITINPKPSQNPTKVMTFTLDPAREPKTIDVTGVGAEKAPVMLGIYRVDGPNLLVCFDPKGVKRPTEFDTKPGSGHNLAILRRAKPNAKAPDGPASAKAERR
jgi:RNA polymerase sigma factor (sigma-70 family)